MVYKRLAPIGTLRTISTGDDDSVSVKVDAGLCVRDLFGVEGSVLQVGDILGFILQLTVVIHADKCVGQNIVGRLGIVMKFCLIPRIFHGDDQGLVCR